MYMDVYSVAYIFLFKCLTGKGTNQTIFEHKSWTWAAELLPLFQMRSAVYSIDIRMSIHKMKYCIEFVEYFTTTLVLYKWLLKAAFEFCKYEYYGCGFKDFLNTNTKMLTIISL